MSRSCRLRITAFDLRTDLEGVLSHTRDERESRKNLLLGELQHESQQKREVTRNTTITTFCCQNNCQTHQRRAILNKE
jgi:hypothetical protein